LIPFDAIGALAQVQEPTAAMGFIDRLARTPLSQVVIFVAVCTLIRLALVPKLFRTPKHLRSGGYTGAKILNEVCDALIYAGVFVFLIIRPFGVQTFFIPSGSMLETLQLRDYIVANKLIYRYSEPQVGDIVVFRPPPEALRPGQGETDFIKRCIGVPGQVVEIRGGRLYRDGEPVNEPYLREPPEWDFKLVEVDGELWPVNSVAGFYAPDKVVPRFQVHDPFKQDRLMDSPPARIPEGYFLMAGDNRNFSLDSRGWGLVPRRQIIGRSEFIWFPLGRWGVTR
jgi:signal peptidase I